MKAIIEHTPNFLCTDNSDNLNNELVVILALINRAKNSEDLKALFETKFFNNFIFGYGSSHFWVHQKNIKNNVTLSNRIIIVPFNTYTI